MSAVDCPVCGGRGYTVTGLEGEKECYKCKGTGVVSDQVKEIYTQQVEGIRLIFKTLGFLAVFLFVLVIIFSYC